MTTIAGRGTSRPSPDAATASCPQPPTSHPPPRPLSQPRRLPGAERRPSTSCARRPPMRKLHDRPPAGCHTDGVSTTDGGHMSRLVETKALRPGELFALPHGSVYVAAGQSDPERMPQGRLWCAHPPDALAFEAAVVGFATTQTVQLLEGDDVDAHRGHVGYVEAL